MVIAIHSTILIDGDDLIRFGVQEQREGWIRG